MTSKCTIRNCRLDKNTLLFLLTFYTSYWLSMRGKLQELLSLSPNETSNQVKTPTVQSTMFYFLNQNTSYWLTCIHSQDVPKFNASDKSTSTTFPIGTSWWFVSGVFLFKAVTYHGHKRGREDLPSLILTVINQSPDHAPKRSLSNQIA